MILQYVSRYSVADNLGAGPEGGSDGDGKLDRTLAQWGDGIPFGDGHGSNSPHHTNMFEEGDGEGVGDDALLLTPGVSQLSLLCQVLEGA